MLTLVVLPLRRRVPEWVVARYSLQVCIIVILPQRVVALFRLQGERMLAKKATNSLTVLLRVDLLNHDTHCSS